MVLGEVPRVLPVPEDSRHYFPRFRFGIRRHNWEVQVRGKAHHVFVCVPRDTASSRLLLEQCGRLFKDL